MGISHYIHYNFCMYYFVCDTIQDTFCSYSMELTPIVYIHQHFCTTSLYRTHYHRTLPGSLQNQTVSGTCAKASGHQTQKGLTMTISYTTAMRQIPG